MSVFRSIAVTACLFLAACTTTSTRLADKSPTKPAAGAKILIEAIRRAASEANGGQNPALALAS